MDFDVKKLLDHHGSYPVAMTTPHSRFAYVMIHYEGTPNDDLYVLGSQIVIRSIKQSGSKQDIVIVCSENVRESTKRIFSDEGAIIRMVSNIPNPYKATQQKRRTYKARFEFTFNKLYMWNLHEYERVMYMDADNLVTRNVDEMFLCGHYCVTYFNPLYFHTGMMVIKPEAAKFRELLSNLLTLKTFSYDGADQGFLTAEFPEMENAPLFNVTETLSVVDAKPVEGPIYRFNMEYNMNSVFFYPHYSWKFFRRANLPFSHMGTTDDAELPVATLDYCIGPLFKPWNWLPYIFFYTITYWDAVRMINTEHHLTSLFSPVLKIFLALAISLALQKYAQKTPGSLNNARLFFRKMVSSMSANTVGWVFGFSNFLISVAIVSTIPQLVPPVYVWPLNYATCLLVFYAGINMFTILIAPPSNVLTTNTQFCASLQEYTNIFLTGNYINITTSSLKSGNRSLNAFSPIASDETEVSEFEESVELSNLSHMSASPSSSSTSLSKHEYTTNMELSRLSNGIAFNIILLPMAAAFIQIISMRFLPHFHFVDKILCFLASFILLTATHIYSYRRVAEYAFENPDAAFRIDFN